MSPSPTLPPEVTFFSSRAARLTSVWFARAPVAAPCCLARGTAKGGPLFSFFGLFFQFPEAGNVKDGWACAPPELAPYNTRCWGDAETCGEFRREPPHKFRRVILKCTAIQRLFCGYVESSVEQFVASPWKLNRFAVLQSLVLPVGGDRFIASACEKGEIQVRASNTIATYGSYRHTELASFFFT